MRSYLKKILVVDSNPGNLAAALVENAEIEIYGYQYLVASSVEMAHRMLGEEKLFGVICCLQLERPNMGVTVVTEAIHRGIRSVVLLDESTEGMLTELEHTELETMGIHVSMHLSHLGGWRWSPSAGRMIKGTNDPKFPLKWKPAGGETYTDLQDVRSWFGVMMDSPRDEGHDYFPGFPRDGDEEMREAYRATLDY